MRRAVATVDEELEAVRVHEVLRREGERLRRRRAAPSRPQSPTKIRRGIARLSEEAQEKLVKSKVSLAGHSGGMLLSPGAQTNSSSVETQPIAPPEVHGTRLWLSALGDMAEKPQVWEEASVAMRRVVELLHRYVSGPSQITIGNSRTEVCISLQEVDILDLLFNGILDPKAEEEAKEKLKRATAAQKQAEESQAKMMENMVGAKATKTR
jgi:hypothetical protein